MGLLTNTKYSNQSHSIVEVECDFKVNKKCKNIYKTSYKSYFKNISRNNGKLICLFCSRDMKFSGRNNPNCKYKNIDDNYFQQINKEKAYLLGWIASDGCVS